MRQAMAKRTRGYENISYKTSILTMHGKGKFSYCNCSVGLTVETNVGAREPRKIKRMPYIT